MGWFVLSQKEHFSVLLLDLFFRDPYVRTILREKKNGARLPQHMSLGQRFAMTKMNLNLQSKCTHKYTQLSEEY